MTPATPAGCGSVLPSRRAQGQNDPEPHGREDKPAASELFRPHRSSQEPIPVPFLLPSLHSQAWKGRERSKGYFTAETDGQDASAWVFLRERDQGQVTP